MSCCPGIRCKNTGSGYVKPECSSDSARELDKRMQEMLATRSLQDAGLFAPVSVTPAKQPQQNLNAQALKDPRTAAR